MRKTSLFLLLVCLTASYAISQTEASSSANPPIIGITWARGVAPAFAPARRSANMTYHGGKIMTTANIAAIFWGTSWGSSPGDKITGIDSYYTGWSNSNYAKTSDEYTGSNGQVGPTSTYGGHYIDTTAAAGGSSTSTILAEVCKVIPNPDSSGNGYYLSGLHRQSARLCGLLRLAQRRNLRRKDRSIRLLL